MSKIRVGQLLPEPEWESKDQARLDTLLRTSAKGFAEACRRRPDPKNPKDPNRRPELLYAEGLGADASHVFLRAFDEGLVTVDPDGGFFVPGARDCSRNLHLVGRQSDHVKLHNEVLIHVGAYAELVLDHGWTPAQIVFDPFFSGDALDLWGYDAPGQGPTGNIVFAAEAKARVAGSNGLDVLLRALRLKESDPEAAITKNHEAKWRELVKLTTDRSIDFRDLAEICT